MYLQMFLLCFLYSFIHGVSFNSLICLRYIKFAYCNKRAALFVVRSLLTVTVRSSTKHITLRLMPALQYFLYIRKAVKENCGNSDTGKINMKIRKG